MYYNILVIFLSEMKLNEFVVDLKLKIDEFPHFTVVSNVLIV